ncbi:MAG: hypothetical protein M1834_002563 [Cirrosporium novae-zelandiae]|nr:MAG: hypothetical protein M1834_002563 [Cirrosporium novae-zelandiae]
MASTTPLRSVQHLARISAPTASLPIFLVPALTRSKYQSYRSFSSSPSCKSRVGASTISIPPEVTLSVVDPPKKRDVLSKEIPMRTVHVVGPLGEMTLKLPPYMSMHHDTEARKVSLAVENAEERRQREMWGTTRSYLANHVMGVSEGHTAVLRLNGVGFRATVEKTAITKKPIYPGQQFVSLKVGITSHPVELGVPQGVKASTPQPTRILLEGIDKEVVKEFAANIREWAKPEPYKGKGIFVDGETIKLKAKKIK